MTEFCVRAWRHTEKLQQAIVDLPFNVELCRGSLSMPRFQFYLVQDARYLVGFGRALAIAAARASDPTDMAFFAGAAREAIEVERALHSRYFTRFKLSIADRIGVDTTPTCLAYTSYLLATAQTGDYSELIAALLPCFWIYQHVGTKIHDQQTGTNNPFQEWIETYADERFDRTVRTCRKIVDHAADEADDRTVGRMLAAFTKSTEYEWLFWDSAYRLESWPTAHLRG